MRVSGDIPVFLTHQAVYISQGSDHNTTAMSQGRVAGCGFGYGAAVQGRT